MRLFLFLALSFVAVRSWADEPIRVWTDLTGKFKVAAVLVEIEDGSVLLKTADKSHIVVPLAKLSVADQQFIKEKLKGRPAVKKGPRDEVDEAKLAEADARRKKAAKFVREALAKESMSDERSELIELAIEADESYAPARWLNGQVLDKSKGEEKWVTVKQAEALARDNPVLKDYSRRRAMASNDLKGHESLALWCRKNDLPEQEKIHWQRVRQFDPNHRGARRCLELFSYEDQWLSRDRIAELKEQKVVTEKKRREWTPKIHEWRKALQGRDEVAADAARQELQKLRDPDVLLMLETILSPRSADLSKEVIAALAKMKDQSATDSLIRHAVNSSSSVVRRAAIDALSQRPQYSYVPQLIGLMAPLQKAKFWREGPHVRYAVLIETARVRQIIDGFVEIQAVATSFDPRLETDIVRTTEAAEDAKEDRGDEVLDLIQENFERSRQETEKFNGGIARILSETTKQNHGTDPVAWYAWWNEHNENETPGRKPTFTVAQHDRAYVQFEPFQSEPRAVPDRDVDAGRRLANVGVEQIGKLLNPAVQPTRDDVNNALTAITDESKQIVDEQTARNRERERQRQAEIEEQQRLRAEWESQNPEEAATQRAYLQEVSQRMRERRDKWIAENPELVAQMRAWREQRDSRRRYECFPAGTLARTQTGQRPIEKIQPGDMVLSQNPATGELSYKPVLRTTARMATELLEIDVNGKTLVTTKGHSMWVPGKGWVIAKFIKSGDRLQQMNGIFEVTAVRELAKKEIVYNLVVADFHTYFIGEGDLFVHDNSVVAAPGVTAIGEKLTLR